MKTKENENKEKEQDSESSSTQAYHTMCLAINHTLDVSLIRKESESHEDFFIRDPSTVIPLIRSFAAHMSHEKQEKASQGSLGQ